MAYTNAQLIRALIGDEGRSQRDSQSGDATITDFYLSGSPLIGNSQVVSVGGVAKTEGADYSLNDVTGLLHFNAAPGTGTDNIIVTYLSVEVLDGTISEALRQYSLVDATTADVGPSEAVLRSAALVCDMQASRYASALDVSSDGQAFTGNTSASERWAARAADLRAVVSRERSGIQVTTIIPMDAYNRNEVNTRTVSASSSNPRRRYYGQDDRVP